MIRILVAMEREAESLGLPCELIGIGGTALPRTSPDDILVNAGYCGGYKVPVGSVVEPCSAGDYRTGESIPLARHFACRTYPCYTSDSFVTEPRNGEPAIYDMELWKIRRLPHRKLYCLKIVSDNLDEAACEAFDDCGAWNRVRELLRKEQLTGEVEEDGIHSGRIYSLRCHAGIPHSFPCHGSEDRHACGGSAGG